MNTLQLNADDMARYREVRAKHEAEGVNYEALGRVSMGLLRLPVHCFDPRVSRRMSTASRSSAQWNGNVYYGHGDE